MVPTAAAASSACGRTLEDVLLYSELSAKYAGTAAPVGGFSPEAKLASAAFSSQRKIIIQAIKRSNLCRAGKELIRTFIKKRVKTLDM